MKVTVYKLLPDVVPAVPSLPPSGQDTFWAGIGAFLALRPAMLEGAAKSLVQTPMVACIEVGPREVARLVPEFESFDSPLDDGI